MDILFCSISLRFLPLNPEYENIYSCYSSLEWTAIETHMFHNPYVPDYLHKIHIEIGYANIVPLSFFLSSFHSSFLSFFLLFGDNIRINVWFNFRVSIENSKWLLPAISTFINIDDRCLIDASKHRRIVFSLAGMTLKGGKDWINTEPYDVCAVWMKHGRRESSHKV